MVVPTGSVYYNLSHAAGGNPYRVSAIFQRRPTQGRRLEPTPKILTSSQNPKKGVTVVNKKLEPRNRMIPQK